MPPRYVFGSVATGRVRPDSDVDVAVLLGTAIGPDRALNYRLRLMSELGSALGRSDIDVVILNHAPPLSPIACSRKVDWCSNGQQRRACASRSGRRVVTPIRGIPIYETHLEYLKRRVHEKVAWWLSEGRTFGALTKA